MKHVQQFADINKLYTVASCWIIIDTCVDICCPTTVQVISMITLGYHHIPGHSALYLRRKMLTFTATLLMSLKFTFSRTVGSSCSSQSAVFRTVPWSLSLAYDKLLLRTTQVDWHALQRRCCSKLIQRVCNRVSITVMDLECQYNVPSTVRAS